MVVAVALLAYRRFDSKVRNAYAQWWVADMVTLHLDANDQRWPGSWDDLRDDYAACVRRSGEPWTFDELRDRVVVDWNVDTQSLSLASSSTGQPPIRVIWLRDGSSSHWKQHEPNTIIGEYLQSHAPAPELAVESLSNEDPRFLVQ